MARLIFTDPKFSGQTYELVVEKTTVGRADANTLVIRDSSLSSRHCEILKNGSEVIVRDLGSRNGTFVDGARLHQQQAPVKNGQHIRFGAVEARMELEAMTDESADTEITAVHLHGQAMRDQRRARQKPTAAAGKTLEADTPANPDEQTILIPREAGKDAPSRSPATGRPATAPGNAFIAKALAIVFVIGLGVLALAWVLWGSK